MIEDDLPILHVVAGPNGSGKSTLTSSGFFGATEVIDPDAIARAISPDDPTSAAVSAGKEALRRQSEALETGQSFVVETTLAGNGPLRLMDDAAEAGFRVELHYIRTDDPVLNIERVADRVAQGGHDVPEADIVRRYDRSHANLPAAIVKAEETTLYDNSGDRIEIVAVASRDEAAFTMDAPQWATQAVKDAALIRYDAADTVDQRTEALSQLTDTAEAMGVVSEQEAERLHGRIEAEQIRLETAMERATRSRDEDDYSL